MVEAEEHPRLLVSAVCYWGKEKRHFTEFTACASRCVYTEGMRVLCWLAVCCVSLCSNKVKSDFGKHLSRQKSWRSDPSAHSMP